MEEEIHSKTGFSIHKNLPKKSDQYCLATNGQ